MLPIPQTPGSPSLHEATCSPTAHTRHPLPSTWSHWLSLIVPAIPTPAAMWGDPCPTASSPQACLFFLKLLCPPPQPCFSPSEAGSAPEPPAGLELPGQPSRHGPRLCQCLRTTALASVTETLAPPHGDWGLGQALQVRHWWRCMHTRVLIPAELSVAWAQLSAEVDAALD